MNPLHFCFPARSLLPWLVSFFPHCNRFSRAEVKTLICFTEARARWREEKKKGTKAPVTEEFSGFTVTSPAPGISSSQFQPDNKVIYHLGTHTGSIPDVKQMIASIDSDEISEQSCGQPWLERMHDL